MSFFSDLISHIIDVVNPSESTSRQNDSSYYTSDRRERHGTVKKNIAVIFPYGLEVPLIVKKYFQLQ